MKHLAEYRNPEFGKSLYRKIHEISTKPWNIMEVCGGQTHTILRYGLMQKLPEQITLLHGPGCPVCVTPIEYIDGIISLSQRPNIIVGTFGDMLRVPGSEENLLASKSAGGDIRLLYSPLDALQIARDNRDKEVVFFGIGFETTAPVTASAILQASRENLNNFSILSAHVMIPPAMAAILENPHTKVDAFLAPGHVCTVTGTAPYQELCAGGKVPIVVTGFEPVDILQGILMAVEQLEEGRHEVTIQYSRAVRPEGNPQALKIMNEVYEVVDRHWRGLGTILGSGMAIRKKYEKYDAANKFDVRFKYRDSLVNHCGRVLNGEIKPIECPLYGKECTPEKPVGAPMVSSEGACAAYYHNSERVKAGK